MEIFETHARVYFYWPFDTYYKFQYQAQMAISLYLNTFRIKKKQTCSVVSEDYVCTVEVNSFVVVLQCRLKVFLLICCIAEILLRYSLHHKHKHTILLCSLTEFISCNLTLKVP